MACLVLDLGVPGQLGRSANAGSLPDCASKPTRDSLSQPIVVGGMAENATNLRQSSPSTENFGSRHKVSKLGTVSLPQGPSAATVSYLLHDHLR